jgi:hypothetical protein
MKAYICQKIRAWLGVNLDEVTRMKLALHMITTTANELTCNDELDEKTRKILTELWKKLENTLDERKQQ